MVLGPRGQNKKTKGKMMNKPILAVTALLAFAAAPVMAQDTSAQISTDISAAVSAELPSVDVGAGVDASAGVSAELPSVDAGTSVDASANGNAGGNSDNTYGSVVSSIAASGTLDLTAYTDESKVTIVLLSELQGNAATEASALDNALSTNAEAVTTLHANVEGNAVIKAKVEASGHTVDDIVAVKTSADGSLIVYVDDRE
jgi:hypothetical protein